MKGGCVPGPSKYPSDNGYIGPNRWQVEGVKGTVRLYRGM